MADWQLSSLWCHWEWQTLGDSTLVLKALVLIDLTKRVATLPIQLSHVVQRLWKSAATWWQKWWQRDFPWRRLKMDILQLHHWMWLTWKSRHALVSVITLFTKMALFMWGSQRASQTFMKPQSIFKKIFFYPFYRQLKVINPSALGEAVTELGTEARSPTLQSLLFIRIQFGGVLNIYTRIIMIFPYEVMLTLDISPINY